MKQLTCEMCGSTDLMKQDGVFVCQSCGCKYSVEEARKMMIEGTVDVSGSTVKVDNSAFVQKCLANARRAKEKNDWEEVEKYYNMVEQNEPDNIEAIFYSSYGKFMLSLYDTDLNKRLQKYEVFVNSISVIDDNYDPEKSDILIPYIQEMSKDLVKMCSSPYAGNDPSKYTLGMYMLVEMKFIESIENIIKKDKQPDLYHILIEHYSRCGSQNVHRMNYTSINEFKRKELAAKKELAEIDPSYHFTAEPETNSSGGCYIATAVYGSYDCPQVWTLRRFRDYTLAETWYGRAFIRTYYAISPTLVKWFGHTNWFKKMWKGTLDRMVTNLNASGVKDTPYEDKHL